MRTPTLRRHPSVLVAAAVVLAVAVVGIALILSSEPDVAAVAPEPEADPEPPPAPEPEPDPEPEPPPEPIVGDLTVVAVTDVSVHGSGLFGGGRSEDAPVPADEEAGTGFATAISSWLDEHLTALQAGEPRELAAGAPEDPLAAAELTSPERPVEEASYHVELFERGAPEWARVDVEVVGTDGRRGAVALVFLPGEPITLLAGELPDGAPGADETDR